MNNITTVTTKGQVTIPRSVRQLLNVKIGDKVYFSQVESEKKMITIKLLPKDIVNSLYGSLASAKKTKDLKKIREISAKKLAKKYNLK